MDSSQVTANITPLAHGRNWMWTVDSWLGRAWGTAESRDQALQDMIVYLQSLTNREEI